MKRSLITIICLLTSLVLVFSGCAEKGVPDDYQNVASDREAFYFYVPLSWVSNSSGGTASAYYSSDDYSNVSFTCMVIDPGEMDELAEYKAACLTDFEAVLPDFKEIPTEEKFDENGVKISSPEIAGKETLVFEYECTLSGETYRYLQAVTLKDDFFYIFTYTSLAENYEKHISDVYQIISYIEFK